VRPDDLAHDGGLLKIAARRGQEHGLARGEMGLVDPLAQPASGRGADCAADRQRPLSMA
jgi:hypothetical protein